MPCVGFQKGEADLGGETSLFDELDCFLTQFFQSMIWQKITPFRCWIVGLPLVRVQDR